MGCGSSKSTNVRDTNKLPDGGVREDIKVCTIAILSLNFRFTIVSIEPVFKCFFLVKGGEDIVA